MTSYLQIATLLVAIIILLVVVRRSAHKCPDSNSLDNTYRQALRDLSDEDFRAAVAGTPEGVLALRRQLGVEPLPPRVVEKVVEKVVTVPPKEFLEVALIDQTLTELHARLRGTATWVGDKNIEMKRQLADSIERLSEQRNVLYAEALESTSST